MLHGRIDNFRNLSSVEGVSPFSQAFLGIARRKPGRPASILFWSHSPVDLKQIGENSNLASSGIMPQCALCVEIRTEVFFCNSTLCAGFFPGFAGRALACGHTGVVPALGKGPLS